MEIPKLYKVEDKIYEFVRKYENYILYRDIKTGVHTCFDEFDLGLKTEHERKRSPNHHIKYRK